MNRRIKTYLAGPIGDVNIHEAKDWRERIRVKLAKMGITSLNPLDKYGKSLPRVRAKLRNWIKYGNTSAIRQLVSTRIIRQDIKMVLESDFVTLWLPKEREAEVCGSYGEITVAFINSIPVYIVTERRLKPSNIPTWAIGCSTKIFKSWDAYLKYIYGHWIDDDGDGEEIE